MIVQKLFALSTYISLRVTITFNPRPKLFTSVNPKVYKFFIFSLYNVQKYIYIQKLYIISTTILRAAIQYLFVKNYMVSQLYLFLTLYLFFCSFFLCWLQLCREGTVEKKKARNKMKSRAHLVALIVILVALANGIIKGFSIQVLLGYMRFVNWLPRAIWKGSCIDL